jgi:hypothetical protein
MAMYYVIPLQQLIATLAPLGQTRHILALCSKVI